VQVSFINPRKCLLPFFLFLFFLVARAWPRHARPQALLFAKPVDLRRLASASPPGAVPSAAEWHALDEAEAAAGLVVTASAEAFARKDLLRQLLPAADVDAEYGDKTEAQKAAEGVWYGKMDWWFHLKAAGFPTPAL
jgi:hypothetical protein